MVHVDVNDWEDFEEGVVDAVDEAGIDMYVRDGGVFDGDFDGFDESVEEDSRGVEIALVDFRLRFEVRVAGEFAETVRAAEEDIGRGSFGEADKHEQKHGASDPEDLPKTPAPAFGGDCEAREQRAERGAAVRGCDPER